MSERERLIVILGPTAAGKTELSIELAKALGTEIISGDSMLVYQGFDIGSAKPSKGERQGIVHHLVDILPASAHFDVTEFKQRAEALIHEIHGRSRIPILAGGTGLYVQALLEGYEFNETSGNHAYRKRLEQIAEEQGGEALYAMLTERDPQAAETIHPRNLRRVIRALEVVELGKESISREKFSVKSGELRYNAWVIGLQRNRQALYERINQRVQRMFAQGLMDEVRGLLNRGVTREMQAMQGIGYKETAACLAGEMTGTEAIELI
ncbi:MAG: tRNA (adenosine(37)-N6)-dimethylallyltransferase MiaA, partial [Selenomonadaceae bacterium]|nr:tRNA (adenosine(37)-N6)-dimethylallyltransferase MiaA [Selenomonadaceae bacterium]